MLTAVCNESVFSQKIVAARHVTIGVKYVSRVAWAVPTLRHAKLHRTNATPEPKMPRKARLNRFSGEKHLAWWPSIMDGRANGIVNANAYAQTRLITNTGS